MKIELQNKSILVTGANSGIGYAIASELLKAGAKVALHYNSNSNGVLSLAEKFPSQTKVFTCDFSITKNIPEFFDQVSSWSNGLDVLINNAGMSIMNSIESNDEEWIDNWNTIMNINLLSAGILSKKALELFKKQGSGRIINIASRAAFRGDTPEYLAYAASKAGMVALTKSIARGFGKDGITAFSVAPGFTRTAMAQKSIDKYGEDFVVKDISLNNLTEPKDIAPVVLLICSGKFDHGTGSCIDMNAGSYVR
jgi:NAD(P)-dependent dehydrogenase (short-subunit alcohol dehydrogenase family)|tara:strand:- start:1073 stop:1831 length:759 start_codon:yes stop_codon:yes gene_type:complete